MRKRLLILGAGPFQITGIQKAVRLGHHVVTLDYLPDNVGHRYGHETVNCSTTDVSGVLDTARRLQIDGVCTFSSDVAVPTVGAVCDALALPGISAAAAEVMSTKHRFRAFLRDAGLPHPAFVAGSEFSKVRTPAQALHYPVVCKPVDTSGSRGVTRVDSPGDAELGAAFDCAKSFSRSGVVCIEDFVRGVEVGGDGVLVNGRFAFLAITHKHVNGFVVTGHSLPTNISPKQQNSVREMLELTCRQLGYLDGPLNFDVMIDGDRAVILEMSARNGGNGIPLVIERATGVDVEVLTIACALGETLPRSASPATTRGCGSFVFGSRRRGILRGLIAEAELRRLYPQIFCVFITKCHGDLVENFGNNSRMIGYALFDCVDANAYDRICSGIEAALRIEVDDK